MAIHDVTKPACLLIYTIQRKEMFAHVWKIANKWNEAEMKVKHIRNIKRAWVFLSFTLNFSHWCNVIGSYCVRHGTQQNTACIPCIPFIICQLLQFLFPSFTCRIQKLCVFYQKEKRIPSALTQKIRFTSIQKKWTELNIICRSNACTVLP